MLEDWKGGDRGVENALIERVYPMLKELARREVRRSGGKLTLRATELAHEAYEKLSRQQSVDWKNRSHFLAIVATVIRRVAVDYLRARSAEKRGAGISFVSLDDGFGDDLCLETENADALDWAALDSGLEALEKVNADSARVVELRLFSGLSMEEIAQVVDASAATIGRRWLFGRMWLADRLQAAVG